MKYILIIIVCLTLLSCITDSEKDDFSFKINVKDLDGNPVEDLNIILINKFDITFLNEFEWPSRVQTNIYYNLGKECSVEINIRDINRTNIDSFTLEEQSEGSHSTAWNGEDNQDNSVHPGVYFCSMKAREDGELFYQGEIMMYLHTFNYNHKNGSTDADGVFQSYDKKPFVNLYNLDSLRIVNEEGEFIGLEAFSDTTAICLFDKNTNEIHQFEYVIVKNGTNEFDITWNPETSWKNKGKTKSIEKGTDDNIVPGETLLWGNYPNPFN
ncbi:MAG: hypothetical protein K8S23_15185 [Candidatus Cloacimonetes bacterium]|nr:hypothetical protein [Candidatus Cloacimonadota bacterium]